MSKGGRYLQKKEINESGKRKNLKVLRVVLFSVLAVIILGIVIGVIYFNSMLNMLGDANETNVTHSVSQDEINAMLNQTKPTGSDIPDESEATTPEDTWPVVVSNENITNIMLVGQNYREGEEHKLSDTMILCSINRKTKTLTMMSIFRDLYVDFPPYKSLGWGCNRINVCYNLGSLETGTSQGGMEMLAQTVEYNFGIPIDHTIEVNFDSFKSIIDVLGGVEMELNEDEAKYLNDTVGTSFEAGPNTLVGDAALEYVRMRHSNASDNDIKRTARQRALITEIIEECRNVGLIQLHNIAKDVLPMITTDMTNSEITNYIFEFLPMLKDLKIVSMTLPVDNETLPDSYWGEVITIYGSDASVIKCNTWLNRKYLTETLGLVEPEA